MTYTITLDLWIDEKEISSQEEVADILDGLLESVSVHVSNVILLDVND